MQLLAEDGQKLKLEVFTDSTANLAYVATLDQPEYNISTCDGFEHKKQCWERRERRGRLWLKKVGTVENVSDLTTR